MAKEQMIRFTGFDIKNVDASVNAWLQENAGKVMVKQRILDESKQHVILFYEEVIKTKVCFKNFIESTDLTNWLARMQFSGKYFRVVSTQLAMTHHDGHSHTLARDIYYEVEVEAEDPQKE